MTSDRSDEVPLEMNEIARSMKSRIETLEPLSENCCIYIVSPRLGMVNKEIYTPQVVSIGPFHHGKEELKAMEEHKQRYLRAFLHRIDASMEEYFEGLKTLEIRLRQSYVQINGYTREKFMKIMAVDGAFLVEYFLKYYFEDWKKSDRMFGRQRLRRNVNFDTMLIENQLPFFYLEYLYGLFKKSPGYKETCPSLKVLVLGYLWCVSPWEDSLKPIEEDTQVEHLLHFLILCLQESGKTMTETKEHESVQGPERTETKEHESVAGPTIWKLHQAGVKFKPSSSNCFSSIKFSKGILEMPKLILVDPSEMLFRNMQAFEACHNETNYVSDYIWIMDMLINNEDDVKVLVQNNIIHNCLEDDRAAATVFNNLGKGNCIDKQNFYHADVTQALNAYCNNRWHKWKAILKQKYFNNPWTTISVIAAAILLLLTLIQTVCSIIGVL